MILYNPNFLDNIDIFSKEESGRESDEGNKFTFEGLKNSNEVQ